MRRINYKTEPRKPKTGWLVKELFKGKEEGSVQFETKKEAMEWIREQIKLWPRDYTYELFKIQANFIEAWGG